jgi:hypothetical protein
MESRHRADQPGPLTAAKASLTGLFVFATKLDELPQRPEYHRRSEHHERAIRLKGFQSLGRNRRYLAEDRTVIAARISRLTRHQNPDVNGD